ncbi:WD domain [Trypanosoma vivax]|nr:protein transport protein Sec13 [Trypanosoma vivax]KAH8609581.1 WD domain [Trypanosoma vivax]
MAGTAVDTGHSSAVTDVAANSSGKLVASSAEDGTIRIFALDPKTSSGVKSSSVINVRDNDSEVDWRLVTVLNGHTGPVVSVAWAPPEHYDSALLSCSEDCRVVLWCDVDRSGREWTKVYTAALASPPWCAAWAPAPYGKIFAVGCKSGAVVIFTGEEQQWRRSEFSAHPTGCLSLSWTPSMPPGMLLTLPLESELPTSTSGPQSNQQQQQPPLQTQRQPIMPPRIVTCGGERRVVVWSLFNNVWQPHELPIHVEASWREVAWAPSVGLPFTYIAAGSEEGFVAIWSQDGPAGEVWNSVLLPQQEGGITKLSWSQVGTFLLVSCANGSASMWQESTSTSQGWVRVCELPSSS